MILFELILSVKIGSNFFLLCCFKPFFQFQFQVAIVDASMADTVEAVPISSASPVETPGTPRTPSADNEVTLSTGNSKGALHVADYSTSTSLSMRENPPTTKKEVWAFYATDAANSVYPMIGRTLCFPLLLWQLATLQACSEQQFGCDSEGDAISPRNDSNIESTVRLDFLNLTPASFVFWMSSVSGFIQLFVFIIMGPIAGVYCILHFFCLNSKHTLLNTNI